MIVSIHSGATHRVVRTVRPRKAEPVAHRPALQDSTDVLADWFPVVRVLLWDDPFKTIAEAFFARQPAAERTCLSTPELFPAYLRAYGSSSSIEYLADIAELECAYRLAQRTFRNRPISVDPISSLTAQQSETLGIDFHPSVSLLQSRFPIVSIWEGITSNRFTLQRWTPEMALIAKPATEAQVLRPLADEYLFLTALAGGRTIADAVRSARAVNADFDIDRALGFLAGMNIVSGLRHVSEEARLGRAC
jgi:hypothetical protein